MDETSGSKKFLFVYRNCTLQIMMEAFFVENTFWLDNFKYIGMQDLDADGVRNVLIPSI